MHCKKQCFAKYTFNLVPETSKSHTPWLSWANIAFMRVITSAICCWCLASIWESCSWCLASDWGSCSCTQASCSVSLEELFSNSEILWVVLLGNGRVEVNCEAFVTLLLDGVIPNPTPRTRPGRSIPNTRAYASSLDQRTPLPSSPCSHMPSCLKSSSILFCMFSHKNQITYYIS